MQDAQFLSALEQMIPAQQLKTICERHAPRPRTASKFTSEALVSSLIFHHPLARVGAGAGVVGGTAAALKS